MDIMMRRIVCGNNCEFGKTNKITLMQKEDLPAQVLTGTITPLFHTWLSAGGLNNELIHSKMRVIQKTKIIIWILQHFVKCCSSMQKKADKNFHYYSMDENLSFRALARDRITTVLRLEMRTQIC
uniref:Uncharacterized protein n=1 Tax=Glossina palpalis gambiensis TaxID=67801 RepID=A0A1B0BQ04_9MUSC